MMTSTAKHSDPLAQTLNNLIKVSVENYYNPYKQFEWVDKLEDNQWWMSKELLSVWGTPLMLQLDESQLMILSKWESINFYSLNVHGIRELLLEVTKRIHEPGFDLPSEFFHIYIGEENEHMWFFAKFCLDYGQKIYSDKKIKLNIEASHPDLESFLVFARILIFEEIVDYYNVRMGNDASLNPLIQKINSIHHQDESRHIAFGRQIVKQLYTQLNEQLTKEQLQDVENYLKRYIIASIQSFYNPAMYRDAGITEPYKFRTQLLQETARKEFHKQVLKRTMSFLTKNKIIECEDFIE
jgi:P-aminobenzoate N-oxygenase AurF